MEALLKIGSQDFSHLVGAGGIKWSRNDLDATGAGRNMNGTMRRKRITTKRKLTITLRRISGEELTMINEALYPQFVTVTFLDPLDGVSTRTFYASSVEATTQKVINGKTYWEGTTFSLVER